MVRSDVREHYDLLLGEVYSWTLGDFDLRVTASEALFRDLVAPAIGAGRALDLGCGTGVQTLALSRLGYRVHGCDFSAQMLEEYRARTGHVGATACVADIADLHEEPIYDVAVCLGDTVAHLPTWQAVRAFLAGVRAALRPGGRFVLATRDHTRVYVGDERFLLIRADAEQTLTCFLEDAGDHVRVTDILHRRGHLDPIMRVHSYLKLRVGPSTLARELADCGLTLLEHRESQGIHVFAAERSG